MPEQNLIPSMVIGFVDSDGKKYVPTEERPVEEGSILILDLTGVMTKYGGLCHYGTFELAQFLDSYLRRDEIIGAILKVDTGGGAVNSIAPLEQVLLSSKKPVVSLCDTAASAGYWIASSTDHIIAENNISAGFGSIGVVIGLIDVQPKLEAEGIKFHKIYAPESEHKNQAFELLLKGKYDLIKRELLSPLAIRFQDHVKARRPSIKANESGVLTGKMFFADQAMELGLIDEIGDLNTAINKVQELSRIAILKESLS